MTPSSRTLADIFLNKLPQERQLPIAEARSIEELLRKAWTAAREQWPGLELDEDFFLTWVAARLPRDVEIEEALAAMNLGDLYLACGCALGKKQALAYLDRALQPVVRAVLERYKGARSAGDLLQILREQLLLPTADGRRGIDGFSGQGRLVNWLRIVTARTAARLVRREERESPMEEAAIERAVMPGEDAELAHFKRHYRQKFVLALREALEELNAKDRTLLRLHYVERLTIEQMTPLYKSTRSTVGRWILNARQALVDATRAAMMKRLQVSPQECESILRLIESQVDITLPSFFKKDKTRR
jgi:RNA polymerase sigma-70 factor, ECF subfamily